MALKLGLILMFILESCIAHEKYSSSYSKERLSYSRGYSYQDPRDRADDNGILGVAGQDYPIFREVPQTLRFACEQQQYPGYYADPETECQAFHICQRGGRKDSFLCPNGTLFNQERLVCEWWNTVDCSRAQSFYSINEVIAKAMEEADRRSQLRSEEKLFRDYQRGHWVKSKQSEQRGWNRDNTMIRHNQKSDLIKDFFYDTPVTSVRPIYGAPEFSSESSPNAETHYFHSPEKNYKISGAQFGKQTRNNLAKPINVYLPA